MFKEPEFWYEGKDGKTTISSCLLRGISSLYDLAGKIRKTVTKTRSIDIPVICVGNIVVGGSGKTPFAIFLCELLRNELQFNNPFFISRGYSGKAKNGTVIYRDSDLYANIAGDEPLLLARYAPVVIHKNRYDAAKKAKNLGADIIIMDDGLQNPTLHQDIKIVMINAERGFGNKKIFPAGPLRESIEKGLNKADIIVINGKSEQSTDIVSVIPKHKEIFYSTLAVSDSFETDLEKNYIAFCGIANPKGFISTIKEIGIKPKEFLTFPDHHLFTEKDIERIADCCRKHNASALTTEKDYVRLQHIKNMPQIIPISVSMKVKEHDRITEVIKKRFNGNGYIPKTLN